MPHIVADRVFETTATTGTGSYTLAGAVANFRAFSAVCANSDTAHYAAVDKAGNGWEVGLGTWSTGNTLARTTILASSNGGAAVSWPAGSRDIFITAPGAFLASLFPFASKTAPSGDIVGTSDTQTLTSKRVNARIVSIASAATITPTGDTADQYNVTALATAATVAAPSGAPVDGQRLVLRFEDDGTARALTWTSSSGAYRAVGTTLPITTVASRVTYVGCIYNAQDVFWDVVAVATQA
jgi:hypothetical protein